MGKKRHHPSPPKAHSLLDRYQAQTRRHLASIEIEDPYAAPQHDAAVLTARSSPGAREWVAPTPARIKVMASTGDMIAAMHARRQIDKAMFGAARKYQRLHETASWACSVKSVDIEAPVVSGRSKDFAAGMDNVLAARHELQHIDAQVERRLGEDGVLLLRDVLGRGITIEDAARERGDGGKQAAGWWGGTFRRALRHLAEITGFAVHGAYGRREREESEGKRTC